MFYPKSLHKTLKTLKFNPEADIGIKAEKAEGILVVLYWSNQIWFLVLFKTFIDTPVLTTSRKNLLKLPQYRELVHPCGRK